MRVFNEYVKHSLEYILHSLDLLNVMHSHTILKKDSSSSFLLNLPQGGQRGTNFLRDRKVY